MAEKRQKKRLLFWVFFMLFCEKQGCSVVLWEGGRQMPENKEKSGSADILTEADSAVEMLLPDVSKRFCPQCGGAVSQNGTGRRKKFCSERCRNLWWSEHQKPEHWVSAQMKTCPVCGKAFLSGKELYRPRKYCSHACSNRARAKDYKNVIQKGGDGSGQK